MRLGIFSLVFLSVMPCAVSGQVKVEDLVKPPTEAQQFTIMSTAGVHGHSFLWAGSDGVRHGRESLLLRGQVFELDSSAHLGSDGMIENLTIRGFTPQGDAGETFDIKNGVANWKSPVDAGSVKYEHAAMYNAFGGPLDLTVVLIEALIAAPGQSLQMLPGGKADVALLPMHNLGAGKNK